MCYLLYISIRLVYLDQGHFTEKMARTNKERQKQKIEKLKKLGKYTEYLKNRRKSNKKFRENQKKWSVENPELEAIHKEIRRNKQKTYRDNLKKKKNELQKIQVYILHRK